MNADLEQLRLYELNYRLYLSGTALPHIRTVDVGENGNRCCSGRDVVLYDIYDSYRDSYIFGVC